MGHAVGSTKRDWLAKVFSRRLRAFDLVNANAEFVQTKRQFARLPIASNREEMYRYLSSILGERPIDYLEFGVWKGASIQAWSQLNRAPESRFVGFDTFEGLPETWIANHPKGTFSVSGALPAIDDTRVSFRKGLFQDTLYPFLESFERQDTLVVHIDCDLYSATLFCLAALDRLLRPGDLLIFDDFHSLDHEFAAYQDYARSFYRHCEPVACVKYCLSAAFRVGGKAHANEHNEEHTDATASLSN